MIVWYIQQMEKYDIWTKVNDLTLWGFVAGWIQYDNGILALVFDHNNQIFQVLTKYFCVQTQNTTFIFPKR